MTGSTAGLWNGDERERYARQFLLPEIGEAGQERLRNAHVVVIGAGALGSAALYYLAAAGIGKLTIVDGDTVATSNLQRQILHNTNDVGTLKVESAVDSLSKLNPHVMIIAVPEMFSPENADSILAEADFVIDATDNFPARYLINDECVAHKVPFCHGSISRYNGMVTTINPNDEGNACYRCLFPEQPEDEEIAGPFGAVAGVVGSLQAAEAIKHITGTGEPLTGKLLIIDLLSMSFTALPYSKNPICGICGRKQ